MFDSHFAFTPIPGRPTCHCAALCQLADDDLLAVWYAGQREGLPDSALLTARFSQKDVQWTAAEVLLDTPGLSDGNAIVFALPDGRVWLFHTVIHGKGWSSTLSYWRESDNGGLTWSASRLFDPEEGIVFRCRPLQLPSGRILVPAYDDKDGTSVFFLTDDQGLTWRRSTRLRVAGDQCIQPAPVQRADGSLLAYMRCGDRGHLWQSVSTDEGATWTPPEPVDLPNPNAGVDMQKLQTGELLLAANLTTHSRSPLCLLLSEDEGQTWATRAIVAHDPGQEFSYPQLLQARDGACHLLYTWRRERIRHLIFDTEWLRKEAAKQMEYVRG
ncbi:MAG: exo-alpha-sialidase [Armatimonadetes bacterium]|nr:exo-alpha-sialidase [Armatimonadota bacterium]